MKLGTTNKTPGVDGLVDNRGAAALLGIDVNTFKVWGSRARSGKQGIPALMPLPVGALHGNVYLAADIIRFKELLDEQQLTRRASNLGLSASQKRSLGSYFTPTGAVQLMVTWALRSETDRVLEPSLGDGTFLTAVNDYAAQRGWNQPRCVASELDPGTAEAAIAAGALEETNLLLGDFLTHQHEPVDVVIGNPPYVRIRSLEKAAASAAMTAAERTMGFSMDPAGSVWMPFVSKSTTHLRDGGRLAFVLPLDLTYVRYARPLWKFLADSFRELTVVRFRQRVFPEILQNVLVLLADGKGGKTDHVKFAALESVGEFDERHIEQAAKVKISEIYGGERAFQTALLPQATREVYSVLKEHSAPSSERAKFNIGYVSGNKKFFHPSAEDAADYDLSESSLIPSAVSTRQLGGGGLRTSSMDVTQTLWRPDGALSRGEQRYVKHGEERLVHQAYKCRIRSPWYVVPGVKRPDLLMTVFSDQPRLYVNDAGWAASNSVLCGYLNEGQQPESFAASWYSPLTLLSSEIEVHALGGGVMIAVPKEADAIRLLKSASTLPLKEDQLSKALSENRVTDAYALGDKSLDALVGEYGRQLVWEGIEALSSWRKSTQQSQVS
ncbi:Eco57I restriction-modification methylase domain-containing protein [Pseudarthrobacter scleromae]|uniref:Eco57I restriction-modification methylase domain-containing protein n=1 Tax=Pseudarthrobacter scleromae TaxID=158897 RepID=UPI00363C179C